MFFYFCVVLFYVKQKERRELQIMLDTVVGIFIRFLMTIQLRDAILITEIIFVCSGNQAHQRKHIIVIIQFRLVNIIVSSKILIKQIFRF